MPNHTVPEDSDIVKCPECKRVTNYSNSAVCICETDGQPCLALTQSEIDLMLADAKQANELLRERVAELEKAHKKKRDELASKLRQFRMWRDEERKVSAKYKHKPGWEFMADKCFELAQSWQDMAHAYLQALIDAGIAFDIWACIAKIDKAREQA